MPFYEYQCSACNAHVEVLQKISDSPLRKCPTCGRQKLKRILSAPVFRLKGSGWYETDFKSDAEAKRNLAEHPEKDKEKKESDAKAEGEKAPESKAESTGDAAKPAEKKPASSVSRRLSVKPAKATKPVKPARSKPARAKSTAKRKAARR